SAKHEVAMEMADLICMTLLMARAEGIDLNAAITEKWLRWEEVMAAEGEAQSQKGEPVLGSNCATNENA
ncbi:MAG: hypothetical protein QM667_09950, partial [Asticcacaulis sp.]